MEVARWRATHVNHQVADVVIDVTQRVKNFGRQIAQALGTRHVRPLHVQAYPIQMK